MMTGATLTIAALAFIAGTLGAWLVLADLRDSKRRFEARQRLGLPRLSMFGDFPHVPSEMRTGQQRLAGGGHRADPSGSHNDIAHRGEGV
jgi:hypothetical protein